MVYEILRDLIPLDTENPLNAHYFTCRLRKDVICPTGNHLNHQIFEDNEKILKMDYDPVICTKKANQHLNCPFYTKKYVKQLADQKALAKETLEDRMEEASDAINEIKAEHGLDDETLEILGIHPINGAD